jgi:arylsulfatase A-like enzyme
MDDAVGAVLAKIREHDLEEDTLVIFLSDNGGPTPSTTSGNGPLRSFKATTWEGGIRVPFLMQWKGHLPAGRVDDRPVIQLDILPTALAAAGVEIKTDWKLDGVNLLPYLNGQNSAAPHEALYWRFGQQIAIRKGDWKLVKGVGSKGVEGIERQGKASTDGAELYNLAADIGEKDNLAEKESAKLQELVAAWEKWNSELVEPRWFPNRTGAAKKANAGPAGKRKAAGAGTGRAVTKSGVGQSR